MNNTQTENKQEKANGAEIEPAENTPAGETKAPCGCCGGKNKQK